VGSRRGLTTSVSVWRGCWWQCAAKRRYRVLEPKEVIRRHVQGTCIWRSICSVLICTRCHPPTDVALVTVWEGGA
jgi:hypothetical protein